MMSMGQIQIKYEEVYAKTAELKGYIGSDLLTRIENEYAQIQEMLGRVDGATNAGLLETMEKNRKKSIMVARTLEKLLSFMANSSKQVELNEQKMAGAILSGAEKAKGGS